MSGPRTIIPRGKTILPDVVTRSVTRVVDRIIGNRAPVLPTLVGDVVLELPTVDAGLNDVIATDASAGFLSPLKRFAADFSLNTLPPLHFHGGGPIATSSTSLTDAMDNVPKPNRATVDWSNVSTRSIDHRLTAAVERLLSSIARNVSLRLDEITVFLHSGRMKPPGESSVFERFHEQRGDGRHGNRLYSLIPARRSLVIHLFRVSERLLTQYADGFIQQEIDNLYPSLLAQSLTVTPAKYFLTAPKNADTEIYWQHGGSSIPLYKDGQWRTPPNIEPQSFTLPSIPGSRLVVRLDNITLDRGHRTRYSASISIPADDRELLENEVESFGHGRGHRFFATFAELLTGYIDSNGTPLGAIARERAGAVDISIALTRSEADFVINDADRSTIKVDVKVPLSEIPRGESHISRVGKLLRIAIRKRGELL